MLLLLLAALCFLVSAVMAWVGHPRAFVLMAVGLLCWVLAVWYPMSGIHA